MKTILYSANRPAEGQTITDVIRRARALGYTLMRFEGWTDADLGPSGMPGPHRADADRNRMALREIQDACMVTVHGACDFPHITQGVGPHPSDYVAV